MIKRPRVFMTSISTVFSFNSHSESQCVWHRPVSADPSPPPPPVSRWTTLRPSLSVARSASYRCHCSPEGWRPTTNHILILTNSGRRNNDLAIFFWTILILIYLFLLLFIYFLNYCFYCCCCYCCCLVQIEGHIHQKKHLFLDS